MKFSKVHIGSQLEGIMLHIYKYMWETYRILIIQHPVTFRLSPQRHTYKVLQLLTYPSHNVSKD
jgi:hypothetical protein